MSDSFLIYIYILYTHINYVIIMIGLIFDYKIFLI